MNNEGKQRVQPNYRTSNHTGWQHTVIRNKVEKGKNYQNLLRWQFFHSFFQKRRLIEREVTLKPLSPIMEGNDTLQNKEQLFSVIDTTLLKCFLNVSC